MAFHVYIVRNVEDRNTLKLNTSYSHFRIKFFHFFFADIHGIKSKKRKMSDVDLEGPNVSDDLIKADDQEDSFGDFPSKTVAWIVENNLDVSSDFVDHSNESDIKKEEDESTEKEGETKFRSGVSEVRNRSLDVTVGDIDIVYKKEEEISDEINEGHTNIS